MRQYGIGYKGSKSQIAEDIIAALPAGKRLVDLFGGGFAISHCAILSRKWEQVLYNDIDPLLAPLIRDAIAGRYSYTQFTPEWITREQFHELKTKDGYVKWCWSFGCDGDWYIYGKDIEEIKHAGHEWVIHNSPIPSLEDFRSKYPCEPEYFSARRKELNRYVIQNKRQRFELQQLQQLKRLEQLERLERLQQLQQLQQLEYSTMDYRDYVYQDGDVVYCDIPYPNCKDGKNDDYGGRFDHGAFINWAISRPYPVYFSSYSLGGVVWEKEKRIILSATDNSSYRREVLYCVDDNFIPKPKYQQIPLF